MVVGLVFLALSSAGVSSDWAVETEKTKSGLVSRIKSVGESSAVQLSCIDTAPSKFQMVFGTNKFGEVVPAIDHTMESTERGNLMAWVDSGPAFIISKDVKLIRSSGSPATFAMTNNIRHKELELVVNNMKMGSTLSYQLIYKGRAVKETVRLKLFLKSYLASGCFTGEKFGVAAADKGA